MFNSATHNKNWIFKDLAELNAIRKKKLFSKNSDEVKNITLTIDEEKLILVHYEYLLKQFCGIFQPPITIPSVIGTSIMYFKRFYLNNSILDYHPKNIYLICVYLACKIEEFNVSISQFVQNINSKEDKEELVNNILNNELLIMEKLNYNLTIHNFYRPFEGFILDVKTRCNEITNVDVLRNFGLEFLDKILNTDAILLFPPSQIALTAIVYSCSKNRIDLDKYCRTILLNNLNNDEVKTVCSIIKNINKMHKEIPILNLEDIKRIENKLLCISQNNKMKYVDDLTEEI